jgi:transcriptional regulator of arginine metabolism
MTGKAERQHHILRIIEAERPANQTVLVQRLARRGIEATQATLSRDLRELGVVKSAAGYRLLSEGDGTVTGRAAAFAAAVRRLLVRVACGGTQVVVHTPPGQASALAIEIDRAAGEGSLRGALGTIAGDDCIFVACASAQDAKAISHRLLAIAHQSAAQSQRQLARTTR